MGTQPQIFTHVCCNQMAAGIKMPAGMKIGLGPDDIVLDGDPAPPSTKRWQSSFPNFGRCLLWPNGWMDQDSTWHGGGPWSKPHFARWGPSSPRKKGGRVPQFLAHFYCGQTVGCIKMPLGIKAGLSPGNCVLDGDPDPPPLMVHSHQFSANVCRSQTAGWTKCHLVWR